jgi:hypothetical protein
MEIATAKGFLDLINGLFGPVKEFRDWRTNKRKRVSDFLLKISQCLSTMATNAETRTQLDDVCGELNAYMDALMAALDGIVDTVILERYSAVLNAATIQRKLVLELNDPTQRNEAIRVVREAAGQFRGLANVLLV